jgi:hypothetical protein
MFRILHRPQRKICRVAVGFTMLALTALAGTALVGCQNASSGPADVATSSACLATPAAATNTSSGTLLGVNATNPGQLSSRTAQFGHIPILRVYYTGLDHWRPGAQSVCGGGQLPVAAIHCLVRC